MRNIFASADTLTLPVFHHSTDTEMIVYNEYTMDEEYYKYCIDTCSRTTGNNKLFVWQYCIALQILPVARLKYLFQLYFPGYNPKTKTRLSMKEYLSIDNLVKVDKSFYRAVLFETLIILDQSTLIAHYIRAQAKSTSHSASSSVKTGSGSGVGGSQLLSLSLLMNDSSSDTYLLQDVGRVHQWAVDYKR